MAILDLDKIIIHKPLTGISCTYCGGYLNKIKPKKLTEKIIAGIRFGSINCTQYECENCKKKYTLI